MQEFLAESEQYQESFLTPKYSWKLKQWLLNMLVVVC